MFVFLSKLLPLLVYPLGLACVGLILALILSKHSRIRTFLLIFALLLLWLSGNRWLSYSLARSLEWQNLPLTNIPTADAILVLGGGTEPALFPRPSVEVNSAGDRVLYAARLYKEGKAPNILVSGGNLTLLGDVSSTPAADMADLLRLMGVPSNAIWIQDKSENTHDDVVLSKQLLDKMGVKRILLVTSAMHMPRSIALCKHLGVDVIPAPTDFTVTQSGWNALVSGSIASQLINFFPNTSNLGLTTNVLKEYFGLVVYRLQGWL